MPCWIPVSMSDGRMSDSFMRRLVSAAARSETDLGPLIADARSEAEREVRDLLRSAFKSSLLQQAVERLEKRPQAVAQSAEGTLGCYVYAIAFAGSRAWMGGMHGVDPRH